MPNEKLKRNDEGDKKGQFQSFCEASFEFLDEEMDFSGETDNFTHRQFTNANAGFGQLQDENTEDEKLSAKWKSMLIVQSECETIIGDFGNCKMHKRSKDDAE